jgi:hypothetical protein
MIKDMTASSAPTSCTCDCNACEPQVFYMHWCGDGDRYERFWSRKAAASLCVTRAMQQELLHGWRVTAVAFHDRPPAFFRPATVPEVHDLMRRLRAEIDAPMHPRDCCTGRYGGRADAVQATILTEEPRRGVVRHQ